MLLTIVGIFSFNSCQKDDGHEHTHSHGSELKFTSKPFSHFKNLPGLIDKAIPSNDLSTNRNGTGDIYDFDIDSTLVTRIEKDNVYYYTMAINRATTRPDKFENLVIIHDGTLEKAYITAYFPDDKYYDRLKLNVHAPFVGGFSVAELDPRKFSARGTGCVLVTMLYCGNGAPGTPAGPGCYDHEDGGMHIYAGVTEVCPPPLMVDVPVKSINFDPEIGNEPGGGGDGSGIGDGGSYSFYEQNPRYVVTYPGPRVITQPIPPRQLLTAAQRFIQSLDAAQLQVWNNASTEFKNLITNYLNTGLINDAEKQQFAAWALDYTNANPDFTAEELKSWFLESYEETTEEVEEINPDYIIYETPIIQQPLPSLSTVLNNFPKIGTSGNYSQMPAPQVYNLVGGSILNSFNNNPNQYINACSIRGSRALLYSGITIPVLHYNNSQRTQKGGDNKNYILDAVSFNKFMIDKFGDTTLKLEGVDANNPTKVANFLKGKTGMYVIVNNASGTAGYAGHVDIIINGHCIGGEYTTPPGGVKSIRIWALN